MLMDPFTIATGLAGLLSLTLEISGILSTYASGIKNAPKDARSVLTEIESLSHVLGQLTKFLQAEETNTKCTGKFRETSALCSVIAICKNHIETLYRKLKFQGIPERDLFHRLKWPFEKDECVEIVEVLHRCSQTFAFSLTIENCSLLSKTSTDLGSSLTELKRSSESLALAFPTLATSREMLNMRDTLNGTLDLLTRKVDMDIGRLSGGVRGLERKAQDEKRRRLLNWLSPLQPWKRHQDVRSFRLGNTGGWLINDQRFIEWQDRGNEYQHEERVLCCYGKPGAGKTVMSSIVADHLANSAMHPNGHVVVAYFYCDYRDQKDQNATSLVGSLLAQFISQLILEDIPLEIMASFDDAEKRKTSLQLKEATAMLTTALQKPERRFICIDALDELELATQRAVLHSLREVLRAGSNASIFLTGRTAVKPAVDEHLCKPSQPLTSSYSEIEITASVGDIKHLLLHYIEEKDPDPSAMNEVLKEKIVDTITEKSDGMFLLPALHIQSILDEPSIGHREDALNTLPTGVRAAYMQTIDRIQRQPKTRANQGMATLYWVSLASRPLSVTEISHALAVRTDSAGKPFDINRICSTNTLLACCMGLVIVDEETSTLRLVHYSLQEFLQNDNDPEESLFHIHTGHGLIAKTCLTYLRSCQPTMLEVAAGCACCKRHEGIVPAYGLHYTEKMSWAEACTCQSEFPLFEYASSEWGNHVREGYDTSIGSLAVEWLTAKETSSCPCAMMHMSLVRDKYSPNPTPSTDGQPPHSSLLILHCIAYFGEHHILDEVITAVGQLELGAKDKYGWTPLTWAAARGYDRCVKQLLRYKETEVDSVDTLRRTPLIHAAWHGNAKAVEQLLTPNNSRRVDLNAYDTEGRTAISYAAGEGHCAVIEILLSHAEVDPNSTCVFRKTPLMYAIRKNMANAVKTLLSDHRVNPTLQDITGNTALHLSVQTSEVEVLGLLLQDPRVDPNHTSRGGHTPLAFAADREHTQDGHTPLALAAKLGHAEAVKVLLRDPRVDPGKDGYMPLALAASGGHAEAVKVFLRDPRVDPSRSGNMPLALAAKDGHAETVKVLLRDPRVDPNHQDLLCYTPLALAAKCGHAEAVTVLLQDPRVDRNVRDSGGRTALSYVVARDSLYRFMPWSSAVPHGVNLEIVKSLLEGSRGADPNIRDNDGKTALDWALSVDLENSDECRELLRKYMSVPSQTGDAVNTIDKRKTPPTGDSAPAKYPKLE